jgi:hypothetical protein
MHKREHSHERGVWLASSRARLRQGKFGEAEVTVCGQV